MNVLYIHGTMNSERTIRTSSCERVYRAKHCHDIGVIQDNQIFCTSCGNKLHVNVEKLYTHPLIATLQCKDCWNYFDDIEFTSDEEGNDKYCRICGHNKPLVICRNEECHLGFCKDCWNYFDDIEFTSDEEGNDKYCRICGHNKPLVICRNEECHLGFCKRCIERNWSTSVQSIKLKNWKCFVCRPEPLWELRGVCAAIMDPVSKRGYRKKSSRSNANDSDDNVLPHIKQQFARTRKCQKSLKRICDEEDDDFDVPVTRISLPIVNNKGNHSRLLHNKSLSEGPIRRNSDKKHHIKSSTQHNSVEVDSDNRSDDNSDTSVTDYPGATKVRTHVAHTKPSNESFKESRGTLYKNNSTKGTEKLVRKNAKSQKKELPLPAHSKSDSDSDDSIYVIKRSNRSNNNKKNYNEDSDINGQSDEGEEAGRQSLHRARNSSRIENSLTHNTVQHGTKNQSCKKITALRRSGTESSSGKEFRKSKLCHTRFKSLKTSFEIDKDYTKFGSETLRLTEEARSKVIDREECNTIKSYVNKKLGEIQDATVLTLTQLKHKNREKEVLCQENICEIISNSEKTVEKLRKIMDKTWFSVLVFYKAWCKKHGLTDETHTVNTDNETSQKEETGGKNATHTSGDIRQDGDSIVSECDSEEIFSGDESRRQSGLKNKNVINEESDAENKWISVRSKSAESRGRSAENTMNEEADSENTGDKDMESCARLIPRILQDDSNKDVEEDRISPILGAVKTKKDFNKAEDGNSSRTKKSKSLVRAEDLPGNKINESSKSNDSTRNQEGDLSPRINSLMDASLNDIFENSDEISGLANSTRVENAKNENATSKEDTAQESDIVESSLNDIAGESAGKEISLSSKASSRKNSTSGSIDFSVSKVRADESSKVNVKRNAKTLKDSSTANEEKLADENSSHSDYDIHSDSTILLPITPKDNDLTSERAPDVGGSLGNLSEKGCSELEAEEAAKRALLFSDSDVSIEYEEEDRDEEKAKRSLLTSSESDSPLSLNSQNALADTDVDSGSKISFKRKHDMESDSSAITTRSKRKRFNLDRDRHLAKDEKLQMVCEVRLEPLPSRVLRKYKKALETSRRNVENRTIKSLVDLDNLERSRKKRANDDSVSDDSSQPSSTSKELRRKARPKNDKDLTLDPLEEVENDDSLSSPTESFEKTDTKGLDRPDSALMGNEALLSLANDDIEKQSKQLLLAASDSSAEEEEAAPADSTNNDKTVEKKKKKSNKSDTNSDSTKESVQENGSSSSEQKVKKEKSWREDKLLTLKFSDSDSENEEKKWAKSQERQQSKDDDKTDSQTKKRRKKRKGGRRIFDSDSDMKDSDSSSDSDQSVLFSSSRKNSSDSDNKSKKKRQKRTKSSDSDASLTETRPKPKRKRIKQPVTDSDSNNEAMSNSQGSPNKSGRKNIRKVIKDKQVADDTKQAAKEEEDRLKRIAERQKLYNEIYEMKLANEEKVDKLVLDFDPETKKELVTVHEGLVKRLKPHQAKGIKFMWDACFESVERIKTSKGSGCILAHCMGLGKSLQVITLTHTLLTHEETGVKTVMVVCPLSTVLNWVNEYNTWLKNVDNPDDIEVYEMTKSKKNYERMYKLQDWQRNGGILIIGYEMFRNLSNATKKMRKSMKETILQCLVDPGADLVVCDEGHLLKNEDTALSKCMRQVKTLRRIVLTGTPLQNNLKEYHCMVQFVKPNLLGTKKEFSNRFVQPIVNGQFDNSTPQDVKLMKKRAHVLHKMLEGSVQRFDYAVLTPFLPPKQEYVIFIRLTDVQIRMYQYYLDNFARKQHGVGKSLFADFQELQRIWTHPIVLRLNAEKLDRNERKRYSSESEGSLKDFIDDGSDSDICSTSGDSDVQSIDSSEQTASKRTTRNNPIVNEPEPTKKEDEPKTEWWTQFIQSEHFHDMRISAKLVLLFEILEQSNHIGDKVLVFSQSLYSLTLIEEFLHRIDQESQKGKPSELLEGHTGNWVLGADYFRLDGQTSAENRSIWCRAFNKPSNTRARLFLISTRAGGLGINLTAANRVIIFDASWNPSHDVQSIFRIYRFGQKKPCYVYRLLAHGTMEQKIYNRQVTKLSLSCRVVDEQQIERHYSNASLNELYSFETVVDEERGTFQLPKDRVLADILLKYKNFIESYHEHDSLLENRAEEELDEEDRKQAWLEYEEEKKGRPVMAPIMSNDLFMLQHANMIQAINMRTAMNQRMEFEELQQLIRKDYPNMTPELQAVITQKSLSGMYNYMERQAGFPVQQMAYGVNMVNARNNVQPTVQQVLSGNNAQNLNILQNQLISAQLQQQASQRNNYDARVVNSNQMPRNLAAGTVITVDDAEIPTSSRNAQASAQTPGDSKGQEE